MFLRIIVGGLGNYVSLDLMNRSRWLFLGCAFGSKGASVLSGWVGWVLAKFRVTC